MYCGISLPLVVLLARTAVAEGGGEEGPSPADLKNIQIQHWLGWTWAAIVGAILVYRVLVTGFRYARKLSCLAHDKQTYFAIPNSRYAALRKHILEAPLFRARHMREFRLSTAVNVGTLPSRLQTLFLSGYVGMNIAFCVISIDWTGPTMAKELRNRTGVLSVMNMLPLFLMAGRNNPLIYILGISFDTYNMLHRWIGRIVVLEAVTHTLAWMISEANEDGWAVVAKAIASSQLIMTGTIGTSAFVLILLQSPSVVRHAYYEVFLHVHIALAITAIVAVWIHLKTLPQQAILMGVIIIWIAERAMRVYLIVRNNVGRGGTRAEVEAMPGDAIRITLRMARPWKFTPGQHIYLYMPSVGWWTSHPFSLAWSDEEQDDINEKGGLPSVQSDVLRMKKTTMSLIIRRRTGFTEKLWKKAEKSVQGRFITSAIVEGPYGNQSLTSYGHVLLFAAGVGITHQVPHVRHLIAAHGSNTCATRQITLIWIIQSPEHLEWIRPWMTQILGMPHRREILKILLFVTRPRSTKEIHSPSSSVQMFPGKPDVAALVKQQQARQVGAMAVSVCGTGSLSDDVRRAVREVCERTEMDFVDNAFSW